MDFQRLAVFRAVARHLSFSRAADELHLSQPAVSKHVQQLEAELGVSLFHRPGRRVELTEAGRIVADYVQRLSVLTEEVRRVLGELEGVRRGYLRLGASTTPGLYLLPEILARFRKQYPGVETTLAITNSADVTRRVLSGEFDLGLVGVPSEAPGLQVRPLVDDEIVLIVPAGHALARQRAFASDLLAQATLIVREPGSATRQIVEANLLRLGAAPKDVLEMTGCEGVKRAVAAGLGVAFVSRCAITLEVAQKAVSVSEIPELRFARQLSLIARKDARPSAAALAFLALMRKG
ncbi:MAG TPA: selenium metabolism-associated LysR family transcriptional regulator [Anaerolineales bacterium]|nr:selenium metabolism-associated LysR family transcriptional regulator [Anaerolineales bacterium]